MTEGLFFVAAAFVAAGVILSVAAPLLRSGQRLGEARRAAYDLAVFKDQLAEIDRDLDAGRLNATEAQAAKAEIERRMLRVVDKDAGDAVKDAAKPMMRAGVLFPLALGVVAVLATVGLYLNIGAPGVADAPLAQRTEIQAASGPGGAQGEVAEGRAMIGRLRDRLTANPEDVQGWVMLGRTHRALGEHILAVRAFEKALEVAGQNASAGLIADYGETLVFESFGTVSPRAVETFERALQRDPTDIKSRFYIAVARSQSGDYRGAIALWRGLTADAPPDAPWLPAVQERMADAAMRGSIIPMSVPPERPAQPASVADGLRGAIAGGARPTQDDVAAVNEMAPEDQQAFIRSMVQRLADRMEENPDDADGWIRLGRAYLVLGEEANAKTAFRRAKARLEDILANTPADAPTRPSIEATLSEIEGLIEG